jgi:AcrR family transcriptional regulator
MSLPAPVPSQGRRERKRQQTLDHLSATAFELFEVHGYDSVTMEQIAAAADVAKGTLYNHFPVKEALLAHQFRQELATDMDLLRQAICERCDFRGRLSKLLAISADWCEARRTYLPHYLRFRFLSAANLGSASADPEIRSGMDRVYETLILQAQEAGELRADLAPDQLASLLQHLYLAALVRWLTQPGLALTVEFAAIVALFMDGAAARGTAQP